jgi:nucleoside phosphorylase
VILVVAATEREAAGANGAVAIVCGVGPVEAAAATAAGIAAHRPAAVLHVGIAGARRECGIVAPALVIGSEAVYSDLTYHRAKRSVAGTPKLVAAARRALPDASVVPIGTSGQVGGGGLDVEAMEGFGVLRAAELAGVPAVEVRAIANEIEAGDRSTWRFEEAFAAIAAATPRLLEEIKLCVT